jgi:hypothetical protein
MDYMQLQLENEKEREHLGDLNIDEKKILKQVLNK